MENILNKDIFNKSYPNIIFYGLNLNLNEYLKSKFGIFIDIFHDKIPYKNNQYCKIFDIGIIKNKNSEEFLIFLKSIISSNNYYSKYNQHIIVFNNYNYIYTSLQTKLRVIIEKYRKTTQFIIITDSFSKIIDPIQSRCLCIRIPTMNFKQKREFIKCHIKDKSYEKRIPIYDCIYNLSDKQEIIQYAKFNKYIQNNEDIYLKIYKKLNLWIWEGINIREIKEYSYNILKYDIVDVHKKLCEYFIIDHKYTSKQKFKIIKCLTECEYEFKKSYRSLVHIEKLFIQLIYLLA